MADMTINNRTLVEVARGRMKPLGKCTPAEKRRAERISAQKKALARRWTELVKDLGETWVPGTPFVLCMAAGDWPSDATLPEFEAEVARLEAARGMRDKGTGSVN